MAKKKMSNASFNALILGSVALISGLLIVGNQTAIDYETIISTTLGQDMSKVVEIGDAEKQDSVYFKSEFSSEEELKAESLKVSQQVENEGITLLKNTDNVLPLGSGKKVSLFSEASVDPVYGGTGSGSIDTSTVKSFKQAFEDAGYTINTKLWDFYMGNHDSYKRKNKSWSPFANSSGEYLVNECPASEYTAEVKSSFASYNDAAIFVLSRSGGESNDLDATSSEVSGEGSYLSLTDAERTVIEMIQNSSEFDKIIVLVNSANAPELGWTEQYSKIKGVLWVGDMGQYGIDSIPAVLKGEVNPSGRLIDTFVYDSLSAPATKNMGDLTYTNGTEIENTYTGAFSAPTTYLYQNKYVAYAEGIYVGYRYYETRYEDVVLNEGNAGDYDYSSTVQFPFGYGLSYTSFTQTNFSMKEDGSDYVFTVDVTNTGKVAGKNTVQIYLQKPYTSYDKQYGVEKASAELVGFGKSKTLASGEKETVEVRVEKSSVKSYDYKNAGTYIIDAGDYYFTAAENAHNAVNNILAAKGKTSDKMVGTGDASLTRKVSLSFDDDTYAVDAKTGKKVKNLFEFADLNHYWKDFKYLSRSNWVGTYPTGETLTAPAQLITDLANHQYVDDPDAKMPTFGAQNNLQLITFRGASYDDPKWEQLLDQMTVDELWELCTVAGYRTAAISSIGYPGTNDKDGPAGISSTLVGGGTKCMGYPSNVVLGATFNKDLAKRVGELVGEDGLYSKTQGWYAPSVNMHRTAFSGRNFEYFSEDGVLTGMMAAEEVKGAQSKGLVTYTKHFALNDQEMNRHSESSFCNEQAMREVYLKAFQYCVEDGGTKGIMSSYQRIGAYWAGSNKELLTDLLRNEWGFDGLIITDADNINYGNMRITDGIQYGSDIWLNTRATNFNKDDYSAHLNNATFMQCMRRSAHRTLYVFVNSAAMNNISQNSKIVRIIPAWQGWMIAADAVIGTLLTAGVVWSIVRTIRHDDSASVGE